MNNSCDRRSFLLGTAAAVCAGRGNAQTIKEQTPGVVRIVHCGDPQFGFCRCKGGSAQAYRLDLERFERTIGAVNRLNPDLCFVAGDMTNDGAEVFRDWPRLVKLFKVPLVVTPGNHDMGNRIVRKNVERFRQVFGYDYTSVKVGKWRFVSGNSQYWRPTEETVRRDRYEAWLKAELAAAKSAGEPVILATHMPPFVTSLGEADSYNNYPLADEGLPPREERFASYREAGVRFYLAGHTHCMIARALDGITILNAETTCRNFDGLPMGYRRMEIAPDGDYSWTFRKI